MIRILFCCIALLFYNTILVGQFKDYWGIAGGSLSASFRNDNITTFTDIDLDIYVGKFLSAELLLGAGLQLGTEISQNIDNSDDRNSISETGLTAFLQYYFYQTPRLAVYAQPSFSIVKIYSTQDAIGLGSSGDRIDYSRGALGAGVNLFVNKNIALNVMADFSLLERAKTNDLTFSDGLKPQINVGLQFFSNDYDPKSRYDSKKGIEVLNAESWNLGGTIQLSNRSIGNKILSISPSIAYFTLKNLAIGLDFAGVYNLDTKTNRVEISPFFRYHIPLQNSYFFAELGGGLAAQKVPIQINGVDDFDILSDLFVEGKAGLGLFMSKYTALHGGLRYQYIIPFTDEINTENAFFDIGLEIGIQYFFTSKIISKEPILEQYRGF